MKKYEIESLAKSFLLFFILISSIYALFIWQNFTSKKHMLDTHILQEMKLFTYNPTSDKFQVDFLPAKSDIELFNIYRTENEVYAMFRVPTVDNYLMKVSLSSVQYQQRIQDIYGSVTRWLIWYLLLISAVSFLLAYYSLRPIRQALSINKEFMRDIIHDINTPVASIAVNLKLLQKYFGKHAVIDRIDNNIKTIGMLGDNIHAYLGNLTEKTSDIELKNLIDDRFDYFATLYPHISFNNNITNNIKLHSQKGALIRILDNIIGNASKYNKRNGSVDINIKNYILTVSDTGKGIKNTSKVFKRHYKEGDRGMGLGLHIVKTLCKKLNLKISIESAENQGTRVNIDCKKVMVK